jgi:arsenate reductase
MANASAKLAARELQHQYDKIVDDLVYRYDGTFTRDEVQDVVSGARTAMTKNIKVTTFLPILISRYARELLEAKALAEGKVAKEKPELLFVCVHNAGRSQIAAALARHLSNQRVNVRSAGSAPTGEINPVVKEILEERGVPIPEAYLKPLNDSVVRAADVIVTMGCGDACPYYPGKRYLDWSIADPADASKQQVREIVDDIQIRITRLLHEILDKE